MHSFENKSPISLSVDLADLPILAHALLAAETNAWMQGRNLARKRCEYLKGMILDLLPKSSRVLHERDWMEVLLHIYDGKTCDVQVVDTKGKKLDPKGYIHVVVDDVEHELVYRSMHRDYTEQSEDYKQLKTFLEDMSQQYTSKQVPTP